MTFEEIINKSGKETSGHCERVAKYTEIFLKKDDHNYTKDEVENIIRGAYLHDIGKSKIDKNILYKSNGLTKEEYKIIQKHSAFGYEILVNNKDKFASSNEIEICSNIALLHHKRVDGSGYPKVAIDKVPYYVQIITILDIFDALTSDRCYQQKVDYKTAVQKIKSGECGFLDKNLISKFEKYIDKVL